MRPTPVSEPNDNPRRGTRLDAGLPFLADAELAELLGGAMDDMGADPRPRTRMSGGHGGTGAAVRRPANERRKPPVLSAENAAKRLAESLAPTVDLGRLKFRQRAAEVPEVRAREEERDNFAPPRELHELERPRSSAIPRPRELPRMRESTTARPAATPRHLDTRRKAPRRAFPTAGMCLRTGWREWQRAQRKRELGRERERILAGLAHLEARLGVLEWERMERREDLRRPITRIQRVERIHQRQEERLTHVDALLRELEQEDERLRKKEQATLERLDGQIAVLEERDRQGEKRLAEIDAQISRLDQRLFELDEEDTRVIANLSELQLAGIETQEDDEQRVALQQRRLSIPRQQTALEQERDELEAEAERRQREKETLYERLLALEGERRQSARHFSKALRRLDSRKEALSRRLKSTEEAARHLRRQAWEPYQEVGACLADAGVNPSVQPYLLGGVRALRAEVEELEGEIAELVRASQAERLLEKVLCALLWLLLGLGVPALAVAAWWSWHLGGFTLPVGLPLP